MKAMRTLAVSVLFVLFAAGVAAWLYPRLPAVVPTHWDAQGHANGWLPRFWAVAIWPLIMAGVAILTAVLPVISPRRFEIAPFAHTYGVLMLAIQAFLLVVGVCAMLAGAGYAVPIPLVVMLAIGALLIVLGNYMGKLRKNFFIGIRTPWTLASDAVWERTHRLAGWLFVLAGVVVAGAALAGGGPQWLISAVVGAVVIPCAYSFFIYRRLEVHPRP